MVADLAAAKALCEINSVEQAALTCSAAPIVLLNRRTEIGIASNIAPDTRLLGVMLAYSPLHHLLLRESGTPVVATSGNRHNQPICIENEQAFTRLAGIADYFLNDNPAYPAPLG